MGQMPDGGWHHGRAGSRQAHGRIRSQRNLMACLGAACGMVRCPARPRGARPTLALRRSEANMSLSSGSGGSPSPSHSSRHFSAAAGRAYQMQAVDEQRQRGCRQLKRGSSVRRSHPGPTRRGGAASPASTPRRARALCWVTGTLAFGDGLLDVVVHAQRRARVEVAAHLKRLDHAAAVRQAGNTAGLSSRALGAEPSAGPSPACRCSNHAPLGPLAIHLRRGFRSQDEQATWMATGPPPPAAGHVRQDAQLQLAVVGHHQRLARRHVGAERLAHLSAGEGGDGELGGRWGAWVRVRRSQQAAGAAVLACRGGHLVLRACKPRWPNTDGQTAARAALQPHGAAHVGKHRGRRPRTQPRRPTHLVAVLLQCRLVLQVGPPRRQPPCLGVDVERAVHTVHACRAAGGAGLQTTARRQRARSAAVPPGCALQPWPRSRRCCVPAGRAGVPPEGSGLEMSSDWRGTMKLESSVSMAEASTRESTASQAASPSATEEKAENRRP